MFRTIRNIVSLGIISTILIAAGCDKNKKSESDAGVEEGQKMAAMAPKNMLVGVNLEGADFGKLPGKDGQEYKFPSNAEVDYWLSKNANYFRIGIAWEREQSVLNQPFVDAYNKQLVSLVNYATSKGAVVLINPQNFMRYNGNVVGSAAVPITAFADFWTRMANQFKDNNKVWFGLNNEPNSMSSATLIKAENAAITAIRATGAKNVISIPANGWTGVASFNQTWVDSDNKLTNASMLLQVKDSGNNNVVELHFYWDQDAGGGYPSKECTRNPVNELAPVVSWTKANNKKILIGEFGVPNTTVCQKNLQDFLQYTFDNNQYIVGSSFWAGGPWWGSSYILDIYPKNFGKSNQTDDARVGWMVPFWKSAINPVSTSYIPNWSGATTSPTATATAIVDAGTPVKDSGAADTGIKDAGAPSVDAGAQVADAGNTTSELSVSFTNRNLWDSGSCWNGTIKNNSKSSRAFHGMNVEDTGATLRDYWDIKTASKQGAKFPIILRPTTPQWMPPGGALTFGFCLDSKTPKVVPVASGVY